MNRLVPCTSLVRASMAAVTLALVAPPASAQWTGGLKAGSGQGAYTGASEFTWKPGQIAASLFFTKPFKRNVSIQPELSLTQKAGESVVAGTSLTFRATYLSVPLLLRYDVGRSGVRPYLLLGPSLVLQSGCTVQFVTAGLVSQGPCENAGAGSGSFNKVDLGLEAGIGLRIPIGSAALLLEGRGSSNVRTEIVPLETSQSRGYGWSVLAGFSRSLPRLRGPAGTAPLPGTAVRVVEAPQSTTAATPLPTIPVESLVEQRTTPLDSAITAPASGRLMTISAVNADVRPILIGIAREAGIDMIVTSDVNRRVSINLKDVTAMEAIVAIASAADLTVALPRQRELPAVVFYQLPVDVNKESATTIAARFGVSLELARYIVEQRDKP